MANEKKKAAVFILPAMLAVAVIGVFALEPKPIGLAETSPEDVGKALLSFLLISLFIERSIEVYTAIWRAPKRQQLLAKVQESRAASDLLTAEIEAERSGTTEDEAKRAETISDLTARKDEKEDDLAERMTALEEHRSETRNRASIASVTLGFLIALAGIRALAVFTENAGELTGYQSYLFTGLDVVITAALVGGGADGIHKLISIFTTYAEQTKARTEGRQPVSAGTGT